MAQWIGTDDTPTTGFWSPTNNAGANMVQTAAFEYDHGGVGDGNLTRSTAFPDGTGDNDRVTDYFPDWRNRVVATKSGVLLDGSGDPDPASETDSLHRPITYTVYDNLNQATDSLLFDGDGVTIADANTDGVPDQPASSLLRAKSTSAFDDQGRVFQTTQIEVDQTTGAIGAETISNNWFYNHRGLVSQTDDPVARSTTFEHDGVGRLLATTLPDPDGAGGQSAPVYQTEYDGVGNIVAETDALGNVTAYEFDEANRLVKTTQPDPDGAGALLSPVILYAYNAAGWLASSTDPLSRSTGYAYDRLGREISRTLPDPDGAGPDSAPIYQTTYSAIGQALTQTDALGNVTTYEYDPIFQWLAEVTQPDPDGAGPLAAPVTEYAYNNLGDMLSMTDPLGRVTSYDYNALGQNTKITQPDPDGAGAQLAPWTVLTLDVFGSVLTSTDRLDQTSESVYDGFHRLAQSIDANGDATLYSHDLAGNMLSLTDPVGNVTQWEYDGLDRAIAETITVDSVELSREFTFDAVGNVLEKTDRDGRVTQYVYDNLYRQTAEKWLDGLSVIHQFDFTYDAASQMLTAGDAAAEYTYVYDALGRVTSETQDITGLTPQIVLATAYDAMNNRVQLAAGIGGDDDFVNDYAFDNLYRVTQVTQQGQSGGNAVAEKRVDLTYDMANQRDTVTRYADVAGTQVVAASTYGFDGTGRLTSLSHDKGATNLAQYAWAYDAANWVSQFVSATDGTSDYTYDQRGQLTASDHSYQADESDTYDENGNRTNAGFVIGDHNRLLSDGTYNYEYDQDGNRVKRTNMADGSYRVYGWDHRNRQVSVTDFDAADVQLQKVEYTYDFMNRLLSRTYQLGLGAPATGHFVYDGTRMTLVFEDGADLTNRLFNGPQIDEALADEVFANWDPQQVGDVYWLLGDNQQTIRDVASYDAGLDATTVVNHRQFTSFGRLVDETNAALGVLNLAYTGRWVDAATGDQWNGNRWYNSFAHTWLSEDPIYPRSGANPYTYVGSGPTNWVDPEGLIPGLSYYNEFVANIFEAGATAVLPDSAKPTIAGIAGFTRTFGQSVDPLRQTVHAADAMAHPVQTIQNVAATVDRKVTDAKGAYQEGGIFVVPGEVLGTNKIPEGIWNVDLSQRGKPIGDVGDRLLHFGAGTSDACFVASATGGGVYKLGTMAEARLISGGLASKALAPMGTGSYSDLLQSGRYLKQQGFDAAARREILSSFERGTVRFGTASADEAAYRFFNDPSRATGRYLTPQFTNNPLSQLALPPGNTGTLFQQFVIPEGTSVIRGTVGPNFGLPGGGGQIFISDPAILRPVPLIGGPR